MRRICQGLAPSTVAASTSSCGTWDRPAYSVIARNGIAPQSTRAVMTTQPWVVDENQLCLSKLTPGIWSIRQLTTPKSASTIHANTCVATMLGMAQTSIIAIVMAIRTQPVTRRISSANAEAQQHRERDDTTVNTMVRQTTSQKIESLQGFV